MCLLYTQYLVMKGFTMNQVIRYVYVTKPSKMIKDIKALFNKDRKYNRDGLGRFTGVGAGLPVKDVINFSYQGRTQNPLVVWSK